MALDRLLKLHGTGHIKIPEQQFSQERDASLLLLPPYGYIQQADPRMRFTYARVREHLGRKGLLYRYASADDGLQPGEGAFAI